MAGLYRSVEELVAEMTIHEKIGQMTQVSCASISPAEVADHAIGSVLSGGNDNPEPNEPAVWADMVGSFVAASGESRLGIPIIYGVDAVHGYSNVRGATVFPHNIGLGAIGDADLMRRIGRITATEMAATGVRWAFAPTVAVPRDIRWGRTYEGFGRSPQLVAALGAAQIEGMQSASDGETPVLACAKHFVGDGGTTWGSAPRYPWTDNWAGWGANWKIDQGDLRASEAELRSTHLPPYVAAIDAGVMSVMASYSSWNGVKVHSHRALLTQLLKKDLGFSGFVVSDWMGVDQIGSDYDAAVVAAINAGIDMVMVPHDFRRFIDIVARAVGDGLIPRKRIDDAVRRILAGKAAIGLGRGEQEPPALSVIGSLEHRSIAAEAARRSAVLIKDDGVLPLGGPETIEVAGVAANDIGLQCGGWTAGWSGGRGPQTEGTTLYEALHAARPDAVRYDATGAFAGDAPGEVGVVCLAEDPYAEGGGDCAIPTFTEHQRAVFSRMRARCRRLVLVIYSGRPLVVADAISEADAVVAAWLPGSEASGLAELLLGRHDFEGTLPQPWPGSADDLDDPGRTHLYPAGHATISPGSARGSDRWSA